MGYSTRKPERYDEGFPTGDERVREQERMVAVIC